MTLQQMSFERFSELALDNKAVMVYREIMADRLTPISIIERLHE